MAKTSLISSGGLLLVTFICFSHYTFSHQCRTGPIIFNFGDSNSDTGRLVALNMSNVNFPYGRTFFGEITGRLSDGRLIIDFLCQSLNRTFLRPYVGLLVLDTFTNGTSFSVVGSETMPGTTPFSLNVQVSEFNKFYSRSSVLGATATGIGNYIGESGFSSALYMIDIGQNDLSSSFDDGLSYDQVVKNIIPAALEEISKTIKDIYDRSGRKFWVHNTGPLGCLPQKLATVPQINSQDRDSIGCIASYNAAARVFNQGLFQLTQMLRSELNDSVIVYVDIYAIKLDLIANATQYGFTSPLMACCGFGGPPYNYNPLVPCGSPGYNACDPTSPFINWDGVHYTEAANTFVASRILSTNSTPNITYDFFCRQISTCSAGNALAAS